MQKTKIAIAGGLGRMGQKTLVEILEDDSAVLSGVLVRKGSYALGTPVLFPDTQVGTGQNYSDDRKGVFRGSDVVIDFTTPDASVENANVAAKTKTPLVIGATGFSDAQLKEIIACAKAAPILLSYNMSFAITALGHALQGLSGDLGDAFHVEITDVHHKDKKDAPSGTALMLGEAIGRPQGAIKYTSHRKGHEIGEHRILFSGPGEEIEVIHRARDRRLFARGAVLAAHWLKGKKPGFYTLKDIL